MKTALFISLVVLLLVGACIIADAASAACPTPPSPLPTTLIAVGGVLNACSVEATTSVELERDGVVLPALPIAMPAGANTILTGYVGCGKASYRIRGVNAAGPSGWSAPVSATFPNCAAPGWLY